MDDLKLEPYAVVLTFKFPEIQDRWEELLAPLMIRVAEESTKSGKAVVGHIKALALFADNQFFRMSVIAPNIPPTTEGQIPPGTSELQITLNVLVYGIPETELEEITRLITRQLAQQWNGSIIEQS